MAIALTLGVAGLMLLPPRASRGDRRRSAVSMRAVSSSFQRATTAERRRYFDSRGRSRSRAVGQPTRGSLRNAVGLEQSEDLFIKRSSLDHRFGTFEVVTALRETAAAVARAFPGSRLTVGDLSRRRGGRIRPHRSHRRGLDADVGFFVVDAQDAPLTVRSFVRVGPDGADEAGSGARFDTARNWALVAALLEQPHAPVQYLIVARPLEQLLLAHAESIGARPELVAAAAEALYQSSRGARHDNHFHVRFYCSVDDRPGCVDRPPYHAWRDRPGSLAREEAKR